MLPTITKNAVKQVAQSVARATRTSPREIHNLAGGSAATKLKKSPFRNRLCPNFASRHSMHSEPLSLDEAITKFELDHKNYPMRPTDVIERTDFSPKDTEPTFSFTQMENACEKIIPSSHFQNAQVFTLEEMSSGASTIIGDVITYPVRKNRGPIRIEADPKVMLLKTVSHSKMMAAQF